MVIKVYKDCSSIIDQGTEGARPEPERSTTFKAYPNDLLLSGRLHIPKIP